MIIVGALVDHMNQQVEEPGFTFAVREMIGKKTIADNLYIQRIIAYKMGLEIKAHASFDDCFTIMRYVCSVFLRVVRK